MATLEGCPWCGGKASVRIYPMGERQIACGSCGATPFKKSVTTDRAFEDMATAWNRRTPDYRALAVELATAIRAYIDDEDSTVGDLKVALAHAKAQGVEVP